MHGAASPLAPSTQLCLLLCTWLGPSLATSENFGAMHVQRHENTLPSGRASLHVVQKKLKTSVFGTGIAMNLHGDVLVAYVLPVLGRFRIGPGRRLSRVLDGLTEAAQEQVARSVHGLPQGLALRTAKRLTPTHTFVYSQIRTHTHTHPQKDMRVRRTCRFAGRTSKVSSGFGRNEYVRTA